MRCLSARLFTAIIVLLVSAGVARSAPAQTGLYAEFTGVRPYSGADWLYGPTFGIYADRHNFAPLHFGLDFRGSALYGKGNNSFVSGLGGFRAAVVPHGVPFKIYGEALGGIGVMDQSSTHFTRFEYQVNAGLDYTFFPRLDWRVLEGSYSGFVGNCGGVCNPLGLSTGIVLRLP